MANRTKNRRRNKSKKRGAFGLLFFELVGVAAFAALLIFAQGQRDAAVDASQLPNRSARATSVAVEDSGDWQSHDPRFTQVIGELWQASF